MTDRSSLNLRVGDSLLTIVPAVHYRVPFAEAVNDIACNPKSRPDVIAVEMAPSMAVAVTTWLRELGVGPERRFSLPCLLGLVARQRYLSPAVREKAIELQREYGLELDELPAEVLDLELDYKRSLILPLSPTDSITEALRCALELDVPVYGIDLADHEPVEQDELIFPDASAASGRLASYVDENAQYADSVGITRVNERRELAMATRLKELLQNNRRVLFTCGLAHWRRVARLVRDPDLQPTTNLRYLAMTEPTARYQRMVIHPSLAFQFLDRLPAVARLFERRRRHPLLCEPGKTTRPISVAALFEGTLRHGIRNHVGNPKVADSVREYAGAGLSRLADFPRLVLTHSALGLNDVPSVTTTLRCAKTFVSAPFAAALAKWFFRFPWAEACDFQDCETLLPSKSLSESGDIFRIERGRVFAEPTSVNGTPEVEWIGLNDASSEQLSFSGTESTETSNGYNFTWTPWEHLVTGLCDDAITLSLKGQRPPLAEPFRGSMQRGIAWKETLRARARGENGLYVHSEPSAEALQPTDLSEGWPVVWIFDADGRRDSTWKDYVVPMSWLEPFLHPTARPGIRYAPSNHKLSALICYGDEERNDRAGAMDCGVEASKLRGIIAYGPVFNHDQQYARWLELTKGSHNPLHSDHFGIPNTVSRHCESLGTPLGQLRWQDDIVRMAIPYGGRQVTVVLPKHYKLDPVVHQEAAQLGKRLALISLDRFSSSDVERAQSNLMIPGRTNKNSPEYAADAQAAIAEERERFAHRMPEKWKKFGT